jgi:hypothetical protein
MMDAAGAHIRSTFHRSQIILLLLIATTASLSPSLIGIKKGINWISVNPLQWMSWCLGPDFLRLTQDRFTGTMVTHRGILSELLPHFSHSQKQ